jgi:hypothetical protein
MISPAFYHFVLLFARFVHNAIPVNQVHIKYPVLKKNSSTVLTGDILKIRTSYHFHTNIQLPGEA